MDEKKPVKISFGFSKQIKPSAVTKPPEDKKQFIDCLESKSIKIKGGEIVEEKKVLVIPLKNKSTTAASLARIAQEIEAELKADGEPEKPAEIVQDAKPPENESLEARAAREIMEDLQKDKIKTNAPSTLVVPVAEVASLKGEKESTLEDYESIPVADFGMAMLRGMGWKPGEGMGKHQKAPELKLPALRPKGMGLGADKVATVSQDELKSAVKAEDDIKIVKGTFVKIVSGKQAGTYGQVSGFDEDSGRLIVKAAIGGANLTLNEFMVKGITKDEYQKQSKVINSAKYEEYKMKESRNEKQSKGKEDSGESDGQRIEDSKRNSQSSRRQNSEERTHRSRHRSRERERGYRNKEERNSRQASEERIDSRQRSKERNSQASHSHKSHDRNQRQSRERQRSKDRSESSKKHREYADSSTSSSPERKKDKDKKRKGKKKRRDRSRSKNSRRRH